MTDLRTFDHIGPGDVDAVGGKGLSLGRMAGAGLPVPLGFCVTSAAHRRARGKALRDHPDLADAIRAAYRSLGAGPVAVRSSATAEDGEAASFAGQQETILGVVGEDAVCDAVARCWASLDSDRAVAYRRRQGVGDEGLAMAVVVQRLVPAEVAGVLFTRDPLDATGRQMLVEAAWGLGESVVSGRVHPDRYHLDRDSGKVTERHISTKTEEVTPQGPRPVPAERRDAACLDDARLAELAELGRRVEAFYGAPRDVEWAWAEGRFWLLQARPITAAGAAEREQVRREEVAALAARAAPGGTVWGRFNLSEVLPEPTPMTWAIVRRFMSGRGGFGLMYRDLGFDPDPSLDDEGVFDLVCGRPYCNLSREAKLHYRKLPYEHPFAALKADPQKALYPTPVLNAGRFPWQFWVFLPITLPLMIVRLVRTNRRVQQHTQSFAARYRDEIAPAFRREAKADLSSDYTALEDAALLAKLDFWDRRTLIDFARDSLKPTALAALTMGGLEARLATLLGPEEAKQATRDLVMGVRPDADSDLAGGVRDLAAGRMERSRFLERFGYRGSREMELAQPRWGEDPSTLEGVAPLSGAAPEHVAASSAWERLTKHPQHGPQIAALKSELDTLHTYLGLRETAKHDLMYGYALIRRALVELDRRYRLNGGVFYLTPEELPRLVKGEDFSQTIAQRKQRRSLALSLEVPSVLFSDDLDAIGRALVIDDAEVLKGVPLSAGVAEGPALVLERPHADALPGEEYILVCPSTDPAWVPLFVRARGLVMESGGVLSHGAIVAREFGLPAVAGLAGVQRRLRTGQRLRVDGGRGTVTLLPG
jgi:pyruvate,water dikinase